MLSKLLHTLPLLSPSSDLFMLLPGECGNSLPVLRMQMFLFLTLYNDIDNLSHRWTTQGVP